MARRPRMATGGLADYVLNRSLERIVKEYGDSDANATATEHLQRWAPPEGVKELIGEREEKTDVVVPPTGSTDESASTTSVSHAHSDGASAASRPAGAATSRWAGTRSAGASATQPAASAASQPALREAQRVGSRKQSGGTGARTTEEEEREVDGMGTARNAGASVICRPFGPSPR